MPLSAETFTTRRTVPWFLVGERDNPDVVTVVLHGLGQRAAPVAESLAATVRPGQLLVVPEALNRALPRPGAPKAMACWSTGEDAAADLADNVAYLDSLRDHVQARFQPRSWQLVGFSQGGLTAARWIGQRAHDWDRVVLWASPVPGDVDPHRFRKNLGDAELVVALGDDDPYATHVGMARAKVALDALGLKWRMHRFAGRHEVPPAEFAAVTGAA